MLGPAPLRDILIVALFELREMMRTRRVLIVMALYLLGGLAASYAFIEVLSGFEKAAAEALGTTATSRPGVLTQHIMEDPAYRRFIKNLFRSSSAADFLLGLPPISLFYAWSTFTFVPLLIMFTATDTMAQELQNRGIRFLTQRTGRIELALGKSLGQGLLLALVTLMTGLVYVLTARMGLQGFEWASTLSAILFFWPRVAVYCLTFLGLAMACSMSTASTNLARAAALILLIGLGMLSAISSSTVLGDPAPVWLAGLGYLTPFVHRSALWEPSLADALGAMLNLVALMGFYLAVGLWRLNRRDV